MDKLTRPMPFWHLPDLPPPAVIEVMREEMRQSAEICEDAIRRLGQTPERERYLHAIWDGQSWLAALERARGAK